MAKQSRRSWLDKIGRWILGALPEEKVSAPQPTQQRAETPSSPTQQQPTQPRLSVEPPKAASPEELVIERPPAQQAEQDLQLPPPQRQSVGAVAPSLAPQQAAPPGNTINQAWKAFELAWASVGLSDHYFLEREELQQTLALLDRGFEEELIEWLFQLCTKPEALKDLAGIIERGQVKPNDNIDAIRAFAYVSVAISSRPRRSAGPVHADQAPPVIRPESVEQAQHNGAPKKSRTPPVSNPGEDSNEPKIRDANGTESSSRLEVGAIDGSAGEATPCGKDIPLEHLELSVRSYNCLKRADVHTLLDLAGKSEEALLEIKNFGHKSADEVRQALARRGLSLPFHREDILSLGSSSENGSSQASPGRDEAEDGLKTLGLSNRALNGLHRGRIYFVSELIKNTESDLLAVPNLGPSAVKEIKATLQRRGLSLLDQQAKWEAETKAIFDKQQEAQELEEAWQQLRQQAEQQIGLSNPGFDKLDRFCTSYPTDPASQQLSAILGQLKTSLDFIRDTLSQQYSEQNRAIKFSTEALINYIASQLLQHSIDDASQLVNRITKSFTPNQERNWLVYLLRSSGQTLAAIGEAQNPPVTRERARQMEAKVSNVIGIKSADLAEQAKELQETERLKEVNEAIQGWLGQLGRLPIPDDPKPVGMEQSELWDEICAMDLKTRCALLNTHQLSIPSNEYSYHYQYVMGRGSVGTGYWREFDNLKQFVLRHAVALGHPDLMPKQTSFPDAVRGVVTSYGGQSTVAKRIGLKYQGQLVGSDGGRRYWTDERLNQLLLDTNHHHQQEADVMPSYGDVLEFFCATDITEYHDKKPHSAIAALTKMGALHWSEVAVRFNRRFISGESQKSVTLSYIKAFVRDLGEHLDSLSPSELYVLFQAQGINRGEKEKFSRTFDALVDAVQSGVVDKNELRSWADNNEVESIDELLELGAELKAESTIEEKEQKLLERRSKKLMEEFPEQQGATEIQAIDLPTLEPAKILNALDKAADIVDSSANDRDKVEFLKAKAAAKLWDACFQDEHAVISKLKAFPAETDSYSQEVQQAFIEEYEGARALPIPSAYAFRDLKGTPRDPKLMQRLVAFRLERDFRLLNLSGTGTGKTLSAIYAAQICGCQRLLISCPNGVIESWRRAFNSAFPTANLIIKPDGWELNDVIAGVNVVIVNHERFQDRYAQQLLGFCINYQADMIVIDEIHQSKRRSTEKTSQRRKLMNEFIRISSNINTDLRILGLSATPVINNLYEGRSLLELIRQEPIEDVSEKVDLNSCMNLYQHFVVHGIRMNPGQLSRTKLIYQEVDATPLLPQIVWATKKGTYHDIEQLLVAPKIASLEHCLVHGEKTVIFVTYIKNTLRPITNWLTENHYSFSVFTGDEKEAQEEGFNDSLDEFIRGNAEVLVASVQCAGTGVDGLQSVCNRAVFFQLPWTSTEFEQTIGRLDRDGTDFESVSVYIPMTELALPNGERWSWCRSKLDRIESKRDIAKAAVDGELPDAATLISPSEASKYWLNWLEKLEQQSQASSTVTA
jgi:superfamily II DNA or RNA helicase